MKYYLHDSNSFSDEKITLLFIEHGYEGLGLFYTILEKLAHQEKPINTIALKTQLKVGKKLNKCWNFMESLDIISSNNGETFNKQLLKYSEKFMIKKEKNKERISQWRKNQDDIENVTHNESVRNTHKDNINKVNKSKVKIDIETRKNIFINSLITFQNLYSKELLNSFFKYWSETNPSGTKMKFEMQKTWELNLRLSTWKNNESNFKKTNFQNGPTKSERVNPFLEEYLDIVNSGKTTNQEYNP